MTGVAGALALTAALPGAEARDGIAALLALAMGVQNAMARRLAVPDLTTTVLTMTLTGIAADVRAQGHRLAVLHTGTAPALGLATGLLAALAVRRPEPWRAG